MSDELPVIENRHSAPKPRDAVRVGSDEFAALLLEGEAESKRIAAIMPQPVVSVYVSKAGKSIDICLDNSKSTYSEWIKGEGGDIGLSRDQETNRVAGAHLPLYAKSILIGGEVLPEMAFDLETGKQIDISKPAAPSAPAASDRLDSSAPAGWYECEMRGGEIVSRWWDGSVNLWYEKNKRSSPCDLNAYRNFRRLAPAPPQEQRT